MSLLISVFTFVLILVSVFLILVVLMQKAKPGGGVTAMGISIVESTFGIETGNMLSKATINATIAFFLISFGLYLATIYQAKHHGPNDPKLPAVIATPAITATAATP